MTVHLATEPDALDHSMNAEDHERLRDAIDHYETLLAQLDHNGRIPTDASALDGQLERARDEIEDSLDCPWAESEDPRAWKLRARARHLLATRDTDRLRDAPGLAATTEIIAAYHDRGPLDKVSEIIARIIERPGRQDALAALTGPGWSIARTQLKACSHRTWREVSQAITELRNERRRLARENADPWSTPIPDDVHAAARQVQRHLKAGWRHPDLDHFDRSGGIGGDGTLTAVLVDGTRFPFANAAELSSPQRILGRLGSCRITGIDPDQLKARNLARLAALCDAASVAVETDPQGEETTEWLTIYAERCGDDIAHAIAQRDPFHEHGLLHINTGAMLHWLSRSQEIKITREQLHRRLRDVGARRLEQPVKRTSGSKRPSQRYWVWPCPDRDDS